MSLYRDRETGLWRFDFWRERARYTGRGFKSRDAARRAENKKREALDRGLTRPYRTFSALVTAWLEAGERTKSRWHLYTARKEIERVFPTLADLAPERITAAHVEPILGRMAKRYKPATVNSARKNIMAVMNYGVSVGALAFNPLRSVKPQPADEGRVEPIPTAHLSKLVLGARPRFSAKLTFIAQTGCRWVEHSRLTWAEVFPDGPEPFAVLTTKKNRAGRVRKRPQPLTVPALDAIERMRGVDTVFVFPGPRGGQSKYNTDLSRLTTLCDDLGVPRYSFHQLRHWAGLLATSMGKSKRAVADFLGHQNVQATERYMHSLKPELWEVAKRLEDEWDAMTAGVNPGGTQSAPPRSTGA